MDEFLRFVAKDNPAFATGFVNEYHPQGAALVTELLLADEEIPETAKHVTPVVVTKLVTVAVVTKLVTVAVVTELGTLVVVIKLVIEDRAR
ncbi:hypothetical protein CYMTET_4784 [Cymbomonas tetramitiformis]|uniref:Uncharacterized protein n=1 Tax=Cymbomonas tetramitiformis TaxID=36881 RepID=A0AAE0H0H7_9CHLO|nr:hypothetical protein CYMTET_4784 [Cymbomonas tetramitiformis]